MPSSANGHILLSGFPSNLKLLIQIFLVQFEAHFHGVETEGRRDVCASVSASGDRYQCSRRR